MTIGERIKQRRRELGLSVDELAEKLKKNRATIYRYESNDIENLPTTVLEPLANALNTTPAELMGWKSFEEFPSAMQKHNPLPAEHPLDEIPVLLTISHSRKIYNQDNLVGHIGLSEKNVADFALPMPDNSMIDANISPHDIVLVKQQTHVEDGQIACVLVEKFAIIRKLYFHPKGIELRPASCNLKSRFFFLEDCDKIKILGLVVGWLHLND